jgi:hypothetical protein
MVAKCQSGKTYLVDIICLINLMENEAKVNLKQMSIRNNQIGTWSASS